MVPDKGRGVGGVWFLAFCLFVLPGVFRKVCIECCPLSGFSAFLLFVVLTFLGESVAGSGLFVLPLVMTALMIGCVESVMKVGIK
jgi:hypothetical protein